MGMDGGMAAPLDYDDVCAVPRIAALDSDDDEVAPVPRIAALDLDEEETMPAVDSGEAPPSYVVAPTLLAELRLLDFVPDGVYEPATIRRLQALDRSAMLDALRQLGVGKVGQRMKLCQLLQKHASSQPAGAAAPERHNRSVATASAPPPAAPPPAAPPPVAPPPAAPSPSELPDAQRPSGNKKFVPDPDRPWLPAPEPAPDMVPGLCGGYARSRAFYEVVVANIKVRAKPSTTADAIDHRKQGRVLETDAEVNGWVRLKERLMPGEQEGWMLIDGKSLGLGLLLKQVPASARLREPTEEETKLADAYARMRVNRGANGRLVPEVEDHDHDFDSWAGALD